MPLDMSPQAVTDRLRRVSQLRRLCQALAARPSPHVREEPAAYRAVPRPTVPNARTLPGVTARGRNSAKPEDVS